MGWGCYKHEWDAGSPNWQAYLENLCNERLARDHKDWGRDSEICPKCFEELEAERDRLKALNAELLAALEASYQLIPPPTPGSMGEERMMQTIDQVKATIAKAEGNGCTTPK